MFVSAVKWPSYASYSLFPIVVGTYTNVPSEFLVFPIPLFEEVLIAMLDFSNSTAPLDIIRYQYFTLSFYPMGYTLK